VFSTILTLDFGFILDLYVGGVNFESSPFKLTSEMIQVLGGDVTSPTYQRFVDLIVKGYLACRPFANEIIEMVGLMAESGLPCFKGDITVRKLRERFMLDKSERGAAEFIMGKIRDSHENMKRFEEGLIFLVNCMMGFSICRMVSLISKEGLLAIILAIYILFYTPYFRTKIRIKFGMNLFYLLRPDSLLSIMF
jgi:hypothetical protein